VPRSTARQLTCPTSVRSSAICAQGSGGSADRLGHFIFRLASPTARRRSEPCAHGEDTSPERTSLPMGVGHVGNLLDEHRLGLARNANRLGERRPLAADDRRFPPAGSTSQAAARRARKRFPRNLEQVARARVARGWKAARCAARKALARTIRASPASRRVMPVSSTSVKLPAGLPFGREEILP